jgi:hypothetical protein
MPLKRGTSKKTTEKNFHELRHGKTFSRTEKKYGKKRAQKQMVAIALSNKRKSGKKRRRKRA